MSNRLWKSAFLIVAFALASPLAAQDTDVTDEDCWSLFTACESMTLAVGVIGDRAEEIGLTEDRIRTMAESRLRVARLYGEPWEPPAVLTISVSLVGPAFAYTMRFFKRLSDPSLGLTLLADALYGPAFPRLGTHGDDAAFILQHLSESLDAFIGDYPRVNEDSC